MANSYNGWPASRYPATIGINAKWEPIPGHRFPAGIKSGDVEVVMTYLVVQLDARVEPIELYAPGDEWGYNYKPNVNNPSVLSCHASGTAIDYNATRHPNGKPGTWTKAQRAEINQICDVELEGVVRNLVNYDEMHFEVFANATRVAQVAKKIRAGGAVPTPAPTPAPGPELPPPAITSEEENMPVVQSGKQVAIPVTDGQKVRVVTDGFPATAPSPGVTARILIGKPSTTGGVTTWRAPIVSAVEPAPVGDVAFIPPGAVFILDIRTGERILVVEHLGREPAPLTVAV